jgi:hypothetical protein
MELTRAGNGNEGRYVELDPFGSSLPLRNPKLDILVGNRQYSLSELPDFEVDVLENVSIADIPRNSGGHI